MKKKKVKETPHVACDSVETRQKMHPLQSSLSQSHEKLHQVVGLTAIEICCGAEFALSPLLFKNMFLLHYTFGNRCKRYYK